MNNEYYLHQLTILKTIRNINRLITRADNIKELCEGICSIIIDSRENNNILIVLFENGKPVRPYYHAGFSSSFSDMAALLDKGILPDCAEKAINRHSLSVIKDPVQKCLYCPFFDGHANSTCFSYPLMYKNQLLGWVTVSVPENYGEDQEEQRLFTEMIDDLSFSLLNLKTRELNISLEYNYDTIVNKTRDAVIVLNEKGDILFKNKAAEESFNFDQLKNNYNIFSLFSENLKDLIKNQIEHVNNSGFISFLSVIKNRYEKEIDVEISMSKNTASPDSSILCLIHDLTERNKAVKSLRESEERFQMLFDKAPMGYQSLDENGCFIEVNQAWLDTLGYQREEVLGKWFGAFLIPAFIPAFKERFPIFIKTGKIHSEFYMRKKNGEDCYISFEGRIGHNPDGSFKQTHCILNDITEKKKAENILREREAYFRSIFEVISTGVVIYEAVDNGEDFIIFDMNPAGQKITDSDIENIRGEKVTEVFPGVRDFGLLKIIQDVYKTGNAGYLPKTEYQDPRMTLYVQNHVSRLPDDKIIVIFENYYDQRKLEEEILQIRKMESIGRLTGGIAHDLNNLLTPILGYSELLKHSENLKEKEVAQVEKIYGAGIRASSLVTKLLTFSRKQPVRYDSLNINKIIEDFIKIIGKTIYENIKLVLNLDNSIGNIKGDQGQIEQIIMNLCVNAQDAMTDDGEIVISTYSKKSGIILSVRDSGKGIPAHVLPNIFDPFYSTKGGSGTGLGLSIVYGIVQQHNGQIDVESSPENGTEFIITFPEFQVAINEAENSYNVQYITDSKRVLIVEDDEVILKLLDEILTEKGFKIEKVSNGKKALELLEHNSNFDLIISDVIMPELNGISLYEIVTSRYKNIKFLFISGYSNDFIIKGQNIYSTNIFIQKPFTSKDLFEKINEILSPAF